jgi:hypothetical protein
MHPNQINAIKRALIQQLAKPGSHNRCQVWFLLKRRPQQIAFTMKPALSVRHQIELADMVGLDPNDDARCCKSMPKMKLKLSMDEKRPEKMQITNPIAKPENATAEVVTRISLSRILPAMHKKIRPTITRAVPPINVQPWPDIKLSGCKKRRGNREPNEAVMPKMRE